jgi:hypothetical protein
MMASVSMVLPIGEASFIPETFQRVGADSYPLGLALPSNIVAVGTALGS